MDEVNLAKIAQHDEWELLGECFVLLQKILKMGEVRWLPR